MASLLWWRTAHRDRRRPGAEDSFPESPRRCGRVLVVRKAAGQEPIRLNDETESQPEVPMPRPTRCPAVPRAGEDCGGEVGQVHGGAAGGALRTCCTGWALLPRSRRTGPHSGMRMRSRPGAARRGRRCEASGGDRGVDLLRGRVRAARQPPKTRTWARRGHTPVVRVSGRCSGRISVAGLACVKARQPGRSSTGCAASSCAQEPAGPCPRQTTPA